MDDETRKKALQHYTVQANNAAFDATNFIAMKIEPQYDGFTDDFRPSGKITGYLATAECKCGHFLWGEGTSAEIAYAIIEGKHFAHALESDKHEGKI